jgi:hypothetical protein
VVKSFLANGNLTVFELRKFGFGARELAVGTTDANGNFDIDLGTYRGWVVICATGGTYVDEASGNNETIDAANPLYAMVEITDSPPDYVLTPLTTLGYYAALSMGSDPNNSASTTALNANRQIENHFGIANITTTPPADLTVAGATPGIEFDYGAIIAGMSEYTFSMGVQIEAYLAAGGEDVRDGDFDGFETNRAILLGGGTLGASSYTVDLSGAIRDFLDLNPRNMSGLTSANTTVDDDLAASAGTLDWPPSIRSFHDSYATQNTIVQGTLRGARFPLLADLELEIGGLMANVQSAATDEITFEMPIGLTLGKHDLFLRDLGTGLVAQLKDGVERFNNGGQPTLTEVAPSAGPTGGGTLLNLRGSGFGPGTEVLIDGVVVPKLEYDFPGWISVGVPPGTGTVDVAVRNGGNLTATMPNAFEYRDEGVRASASVPSATAPIVYGGLRLNYDITDGIRMQLFSGDVLWTNVDFGNYTHREATISEASPNIGVVTDSGFAFNADESIGKAFLLQRNMGFNDFIRGFTNEENHASAGVTAFGPTVHFPVPASFELANVRGVYWINGLSVSAVDDEYTQALGWIQFDQDGKGYANVQKHGRSSDGSSWNLQVRGWDLDWSVDAAGRYTGTRTEEGDTQNVTGHFSEGGHTGFLTIEGTDDRLEFYNLFPVEFGTENGGWGGWVGGGVIHTIEPDGGGGMESVFTSGSYKGQVAGLSDGTATRLAINRMTRNSASEPDGEFSESAEIVRFQASPAGEVWNGDVRIALLNPYGGMLMPTGEFPNLCDGNGGPDKALAAGGAVFRHSRKSYLGMSGSFGHVSFATRLRDMGMFSFSDQSAVGRLEDVFFDVNAKPMFSGWDLSLSGTVPAFGSSVPIGFSKITTRGTAGGVSTSSGNPLAIGAEVGYTFIDDTLEFFATRALGSGLLASATYPKYLWSGSLSNDGELAAVRGNVLELGDQLNFFIKEDLSVGVGFGGTWNAVGLTYDANLSTNTAVTSWGGRLDVMPVGMFNVDLSSLTKDEGGACSPGLTTDPGSFGQFSGNKFVFTLPDPVGGPDRIIDGYTTPKSDVFVGVEATPGTSDVSLFVAAKLALSGTLLDQTQFLVGIEPDPETSQTTTSQRQFTPLAGQINLTGELFTSLRVAVDLSNWPGQSFQSTDPMQITPDETRLPFLGVVPILNLFRSDEGKAFGRAELSLDITPRLIVSIED